MQLRRQVKEQNSTIRQLRPRTVSAVPDGDVPEVDTPAKMRTYLEISKMARSTGDLEVAANFDQKVKTLREQAFKGKPAHARHKELVDKQAKLTRRVETIGKEKEVHAKKIQDLDKDLEGVQSELAEVEKLLGEATVTAAASNVPGAIVHLMASLQLDALEGPQKEQFEAFRKMLQGLEQTSGEGGSTSRSAEQRQEPAEEEEHEMQVDVELLVSSEHDDLAAAISEAGGDLERAKSLFHAKRKVSVSKLGSGGMVRKVSKTSAAAKPASVVRQG